MTTDYEKQEQARQLEREAIRREQGAADNAARREKQIKRSGLSTTTAAHRMKEKALENVVAEIERRVEVEEAKPANYKKQDWYELVAGTYVDGRGQEKRIMDFFEIADTALITCLDAVGHQWSYNASLVYAGRAYQMTMFSCIMRRDAEGRRLLARLENQQRKTPVIYSRASNMLRRLRKSVGLILNRGMTKSVVASAVF